MARLTFILGADLHDVVRVSWRSPVIRVHVREALEVLAQRQEFVHAVLIHLGTSSNYIQSMNASQAMLHECMPVSHVD
jgi:alkylhydroperoxidase/carboxymuconolactone decarboxylase family protein YurZ